MMHTPAPWFADIGRHDALIVSADDVIAGIDDTLAEWQHNAKLIAAAPDLADALRDVLRALATHAPGLWAIPSLPAARALLESLE